MINKLIKFFENKNILILGYGREGKSTYNFLRKHFPDMPLTIADLNEDLASDSILKEDKNLKFILGKTYLDHLDEYDIIMKAPGVSFKDVDVEKIKDKIESQQELMLRFFEVRSIGVTGTKGKSTTSSLIYQMLLDQGKKVAFLGNIGIPAFDHIDEIKKHQFIVFEFSSHQLEFMKHSPNIGIFLNIFEEHLDHYNGYEEYINAKCQIFRNQKKSDRYIYNCDSEIIRNKNQEFQVPSKKFAITYNNYTRMKVSENIININDGFVKYNGKKMYDVNSERQLIGEHYLNDIMFVLTVAKILHLDLKKAAKTIADFKGLHHRLENIGTYDEITYYNDSISTIPESCESAVIALKNVGSLLIGGKDRGINYEGLVEFLNKGVVKNIICMPTSGHKIADELTNKDVKVYKVEDLKEAVETAKRVTPKGSICLLSPAAASYGYFKNFEERGEKFEEYVKES